MKDTVKSYAGKEETQKRKKNEHAAGLNPKYSPTIYLPIEYSTELSFESDVEC